jgi:hypothetical protein
LVAIKHFQKARQALLVDYGNRLEVTIEPQRASGTIVFAIEFIRERESPV